MRQYAQAVRKDRSQRTGLALGSELACAGVAGTDFAKMVEAVDAGCVAVGEFDLDGVGADRSGGACRDFWLEHGQSGGTGRGTGSLVPAVTLSARRARAMVAEIWKIVEARVRVGPRNVHPSARGNVDLHFDGLLADV